MTSLVLIASIFGASFLGSWHCAGMCGPIASLMATRRGLVPYHLGRLISYTLLGAFAGGLGSFFLTTEIVWLRWISAGLFAGFLAFAGFRLLFPQLSKIKLPSVLSHSLFRMRPSAFLVGLTTILLPCGWLYTYVAAAIATRSAWAGALMMSVFWFGSLPALSALPSLIQSVVRKSNPTQKRVAGVVLIFASLYSLGSFLFLH